MQLSTLTEQFITRKLKRSDLNPSPIKQFECWMKERVQHPTIEPTAMSLATADGNGNVSIRTVLLKHFDDKGFVFFSNYDSKKAEQINDNPKAALLFQWLDLERQIKITGAVKKVSKAQSHQYFVSRPRQSQTNAWASPQSRVISSRKCLLEQAQHIKQKYQNKTLPLPDFWGGYRVIPEQIEFWQGRNNRLHDRFLYTQDSNNHWRIDQLAP